MIKYGMQATWVVCVTDPKKQQQKQQQNTRTDETLYHMNIQESLETRYDTRCMKGINNNDLASCN